MFRRNLFLAHIFTIILMISATHSHAEDQHSWIFDSLNNSTQVKDWMQYRGASKHPYVGHSPYKPEPKRYSLRNRNHNGFGRLFTPSPLRHATHDLRYLADTMRSRRHGLSHMPAGYTFLGQFIDHDITLDTTTLLNMSIPDSQLKNIRTPDLDLDSVYAGGPEATPFLYNLPYLRVGKRIYGYGAHARYDLLRTRKSRRPGPYGGEARALIGDHRNDENFIIAQLHTAFIAFHNQIVNLLVEKRYGHLRRKYCYRRRCSTMKLATKLPKRLKTALYKSARNHLIHYYHRVILEDFLPRTIGEDRTNQITRNGRSFFFPNGFRYKGKYISRIHIPLEFAGAAFRYGHSQVLDSYKIRYGVRTRLLDVGRQAFKPLKRKIVVDWKYFFPIEQYVKGFNFAAKIDTKIASSLFILGRVNVSRGENITSLPMRNLMRAQQLRLPSGQTVARHILPTLKYHRSSYIPANYLIKESLRSKQTPLWFYILQEAEQFGLPYRERPNLRLSSYSHRHRTQGHTLGPVGGTIVGEVLIGLIEHYALKTGKGLRYKPIIKASLHPDRYAPLSLTKIGYGKRYMMRNFLIDAGVAWLPIEKY